MKAMKRIANVFCLCFLSFSVSVIDHLYLLIISYFSLRKVLFMESPEHYYNKDNWPPETDRK